VKESKGQPVWEDGREKSLVIQGKIGRREGTGGTGDLGGKKGKSGRKGSAIRTKQYQEEKKEEPFQVIKQKGIKEQGVRSQGERGKRRVRKTLEERRRNKVHFST